MNIGLIDIDNIGKKTKFPNLALMKLSSYHKAQGDNVEWWRMGHHYDIVYGSRVFDFTPDLPIITNTEKLILGGCGYDLANFLDLEIETSFPDYSIYNIKNTAYGFLTRGCPRNCHFCNVSQHQGNKTIKVAELEQFWNGQKEIVLLDPNILACNDHWEELLDDLHKSNAWVDFTQGLDIRLMNKEKAIMINKIKTKMIHFAWDNYEFKTEKALEKYRKYFEVSFRKLGVYVLTNYNTTHEQDLYRIYKLKEMGYTPYVMIYEKEKAPVITKKLQRYVNNRFIFRSCKNFEEYLKKPEIEIEGQQRLF